MEYDTIAQVEEAFACTHDEQQVVKYQQSHGAWRIRKQCKQCGAYCSSDLKMAGYDLDSVPTVDEGLRESHRKQRQDALDNVRYSFLQNIERNKMQREELFMENYSRYLKSRHWYQMRQLVLKRDNHLCQACLSRKADQVHHISYELFKQMNRSAAFELVAICYQCHSKIHPHLAEEQHNNILYNPYLPEAA